MPEPLPLVFDRRLIAARLARRSGEDFVTALVLDDLADRLRTVSRPFTRGLITAPDASGLPTVAVTGAGPVGLERAATALASPGIALLDPEHLVLPHDDYDLVVSILDIQAVNDVPGFLLRLRQHMQPDGLFLGAALGGATLTELRQAFFAADVEQSGGAFARVAPFIDVGDAGALLQRAGFALPVTDLETHTVRYGNPLRLMAEIKALGASNPLADRPSRTVSRALLQRAAEHYGEIAGDPDGRVRATLEIVWFSGWVPHESQQKPLAPGSAQVSLAQVLPGTRI